MNNSEIYQEIKDLFNTYQIGNVTDEPVGVYGGLMHKMYKVTAGNRIYAVKWLNPTIMQRKEALENMVNSERIASALLDYLPVIAAIHFKGKAVLQLKEKYYMVFPWVEGASIFPPAISEGNCYEIGEVLGKIHHLNLVIPEVEKENHRDEAIIDWQRYYDLGLEQKAAWLDLYLSVIDKLYLWNQYANEANLKLSEYMVISHRDLDPKNVMWDGRRFYLIDLEAAGYVNPYLELLEVLNYWADDGKGALEKGRFLTLLHAYRENMSTAEADWGLVLDSGCKGMLEWLEYSVKRALGLEGMEEDRLRGAEQITGTINALKRYEEQKHTIRKWLNE